MIDLATLKAEHPITEVLDRLGVQPAAHRAGRTDFMIRCPSPGHDDTIPSCIVHTDTDRFHCFGCGVHGDVFDLVQEVTGVRTLAEAADYLSDSSALPTFSASLARHLATVDPDRPVFDRTPLDQVLDINTAAWAELTSPGQHEVALRYLDNRGLNLRPLECQEDRPLVGYTPAQRDGLVRRLRSAGFSDNAIIDAGWAVRHDGVITDRFRRRVVFPIRDCDDRIVGVTARDVTDLARAKYLNTPATVAFLKGDHLYEPVARPPGAASIVLCEGPGDALAAAAHTAPWTRPAHVAATCGTALTEQQARRLTSLRPTDLMIWADGDDAGIQAAEDWARRLRLAGVSARCLYFPDGYDPASWLAHGHHVDEPALSVPEL